MGFEQTQLWELVTNLLLRVIFRVTLNRSHMCVVGLFYIDVGLQEKGIPITKYCDRDCIHKSCLALTSVCA